MMQIRDNYIQQLDRQLNEKHLLKHPFYQAWSMGELSLDDLRTYACQYYHHVESFPRYLSATLSHCRSPHARQVLQENLDEEEGTNSLDSHPALWLKFTKGLGLSEDTVKSSRMFPETKQFIDDFSFFSNASYAEGLGALYAYERQIPQTAASKIKGLGQFYYIEDKETLEFFLVHHKVDVEHSEATRSLLQDLPKEEKSKAEEAAKKLAQSVWNMLSGIQSKTIDSKKVMCHL